MINQYIKKWAIIGGLARLAPLPIIGLIVYWLAIIQKGLLFYIMLPVTIFFIVVLYFLILTIITGLIAKACLPIKEGIFDYNSKEVEPWRASFLFKDSIGWVQRIFHVPTSWFIPWLKIFLNAKIGKGTIITGRLGDPSLTEIGDKSFIGQEACIFGHLLEKDKITIKKVRIGDNCTIGTRSVISPGATIKNNTIIGACSLVTKNKTLGPNKVYAGIPAKELKKAKK